MEQTGQATGARSSLRSGPIAPKVSITLLLSRHLRRQRIDVRQPKWRCAPCFVACLTLEAHRRDAVQGGSGREESAAPGCCSGENEHKRDAAEQEHFQNVLTERYRPNARKTSVLKLFVAWQARTGWSSTACESERL